MVQSLHEWWAWVVIVGNGLAGLWALGAVRWPRLRVPALWWVTGLAQVAVFVEVILGVWLMAHDHIEAPQFHTFYGFLAIIAVAIIHSYRQQMKHRLYLLYSLGGLFVMGLAIRALLLR
ncbi:MAG TPA: hypothetical protein VM942_01135 [Acidimicrobiales bacterium]|nr:hypothetical protein [Acidimicrobiales bacterium]